MAADTCDFGTFPSNRIFALFDGAENANACVGLTLVHPDPVGSMSISRTVIAKRLDSRFPRKICGLHGTMPEWANDLGRLTIGEASL